jgi:drug/metabolite transporter (DMT)-like permease
MAKDPPRPDKWLVFTHFVRHRAFLRVDPRGIAAICCGGTRARRRYGRGTRESNATLPPELLPPVFGALPKLLRCHYDFCLISSNSHRMPMPDRLKAVLLMCSAVTLFACLDTTAKYLGGHFGVPTSEIMWVRFVGQAVLMILILGPRAVPDLLKTKRLGLQLMRSLFMAATTGLNFLAVQYLRLDQTISVTFLAPLVVAALAGPLLGEYVGWRRALAIVVGFAGVLIVVRPGFVEFHPAFLASLVAMLSYALFMIVTRKLSGVDPPLVTLFYALLVGIVLGAFLAVPEWVWPTGVLECLLLAVTGALGGTGHYLLIHAYRLAPASSVSPFLYFQLLSMIALEHIVFNESPDLWTLIGSGVVIASGIYLVHRERIAHRENGDAAMEQQAAP